MHDVLVQSDLPASVTETMVESFGKTESHNQWYESLELSDTLSHPSAQIDRDHDGLLMKPSRLIFRDYKLLGNGTRQQMYVFTINL
jgi:hypothetical protein